jgi:hypothetical protein
VRYYFGSNLAGQRGADWLYVQHVQHTTKVRKRRRKRSVARDQFFGCDSWRLRDVLLLSELVFLTADLFEELIFPYLHQDTCKQKKYVN